MRFFLGGRHLFPAVRHASNRFLHVSRAPSGSDKVQVMIDVERIRRSQAIRGIELPAVDALSEDLELVDFRDPVTRENFIAGVFDNLVNLENSNVMCCF